ncbi:MAG: mobile mystery protein A [Trueperaceae bacterium]|nr:MAG: mobile mystery protein A [Trueperaceae bacterium]
MYDQQAPEALARKHLDRLFHQARLDGLRQRPPKGWIRAIRDALGLTVRQLAQRMGKSHSVVVRLEGSEAADTITLGSLRAAAEAMNCSLVYAIVPNRSLAETARERASAVAEAHLARVQHTMQLEDQALDRDDLQQQRERLIESILARGGSRLWDDP